MPENKKPSCNRQCGWHCVLNYSWERERENVGGEGEWGTQIKLSYKMEVLPPTGSNFILTQNDTCPFPPYILPDPLSCSSTLWFAQDFSICCLMQFNLYENWTLEINHKCTKLTVITKMPQTILYFSDSQEMLLNIHTSPPIRILLETFASSEWSAPNEGSFFKDAFT